ncbi:MAG: hypothetical protein CL912_27430 [Deltaproteobacteria bacterium]|nr:hypothetical protein [Deltaproteobacteria bacterium]
MSLIITVLSKIAFQYYPLDLNPNSNPFINSWWPLALADPALFNVSLQTASLDAELHAQKGFYQSAILMHDAVSLIRHKIDDPTLAFQDATMDAVVTLAAIEVGHFGNDHLKYTNMCTAWKRKYPRMQNAYRGCQTDGCCQRRGGCREAK